MNDLDALRDFRAYLWLVWEHLGLPEPTPVQYDIAHFLQHGPRRLITEAFRGVGKSFITGALVTHTLLFDPQHKFLVVSASKDRSDAFSIFTKRLIYELPFLEHLKPRDGQRDSNIAFDVGPATNDQSPSVKSVGITGQITGSRANTIIADDVESLNNSGTNDQRMKLGERVKEFDAVLKPGGRVIYLGTPQTEFSLYNELASRGYQIRIWPARYPNEKQRNAYGDRLAPMIGDRLDRGEAKAGDPTDPRRFNDLDLVEREASYGRAGFALQFMLDTSLSDADRYPLKCSDMIVTSLNPDDAPAKCVWAANPEAEAKDLPHLGLAGDRFYRPMDLHRPWGPYTGAVMFIDPSGRGKDETGYAVVKIRNSQLYLTAAGGFQGGYDDTTLKALAMVAMQQKVNLVQIEDNFGDGMFTALFKPVLNRVYQCGVEGVHSSGQKELRIIDALEPVLMQHRLVVDDAVIRQDYAVDRDGSGRDPRKSLFYQLTRITRDRGALAHDDRVEALAGAVKYWTDQMARDTDQAIQDERESLLDQELQDFMDLCLGQNEGAVYERTWVNVGGRTSTKPTGDRHPVIRHF